MDPKLIKPCTRVARSQTTDYTRTRPHCTMHPHNIESRISLDASTLWDIIFNYCEKSNMFWSEFNDIRIIGKLAQVAHMFRFS
eukprot:211727-Rhodomonas_salina.2